MIEKLHEHIIDELRINTKTDTIFTLTSILLNFIALAINTTIVLTSEEITASTIIIVVIFIVLIVIVNLVAIIGLLRGKQTRFKLISGLLKMYKDQNIDGYYDPAVLANYNVRYALFILAVGFIGLIAIAVPVVILFTA